MKPRPLKDQVWKHGSVHYKILTIMASGSIEALVRNGSKGRWSSKSTTLSPGEMNYLEFVKGPGVKEQKKDYKEPEIPKTNFKLAIKKSQKYVITYAQNATPVNPDFMDSLLTYCKENSAELIIIPGRYRNATSIWSQNNEHDEWWDKATHPYLISKRIELTPELTVYGDISIQPTAIRPLTGMEVFTGKSSAIFGHPKIQLLTVATNSRRPKLMTTTGSVTVHNYTNSKSGKKAEAHHVFGATVVELSKTGGFHIRQINAKSEDGTFIDLEWEYSGNVKKAAPPAEALILGDVHAENVEETALAASFDMIKTLQCKKAIYHDILDFNVRNHHSIDDFCNRYYRAASTGNDSVEAELETTINVLESTPLCAEPVVIQSNHDEAFDRWLNTTNPKYDPVNALLFHKMWVVKLEDFKKNKDWSTAFSLYYKLIGGTRAKFISREDDYTILDIVCGYHGDKGTNGSRGSSSSYAKLGVKTVVGHRHTPSITDGCYTVGVIGKLDQGYNDLPSSWAHANCAIYANGKRSLIFIQPETGHWRS